MGNKAGKAKKRDDAVPVKPGIQHKRRCTDCFFLLFFIVFWVGMFVIAGFAIKAGNPQKLRYPTDYNGDMCGRPAGNTWANPNKHDRTNTSFLFYPIDFRPENLIDLEKLLDVKDLGICVERCPRGFDFNNPAITFQQIFSNISGVLESGNVDLDDVIVCDYAYRNASAQDKISMAIEGFQSNSGAVKCFVSPFPTRDLFNVNRCIVDTSIVVEYLNHTKVGEIANLEKFEDASSFFNGVATGFFSTWKVILIGFAVALILCFVWVIFLRIFVGLIAWLTIIAMFFVLAVIAGATLYLGITRYQDAKEQNLSKNWAIAYLVIGSVFSALTFIYFCLVIWLIRRIAIAIEIIKEASKAFMKMPSLILIPPVVFFCIAVLSAYFLFVAIFIQTATRPITLDASKLESMPFVKTFTHGDSNSTNATSITIQANSVAIQCLQIIHIFGYFWAVAFVIAIGYTSIAGAVAAWYFSNHGDKKRPERFAILKSVGRVFRYHLGSLAFGSLIVAIVQIIRVLFRKLEKQLIKKTGGNMAVQAVTKCIHCLLACIEKIIKFINKNAYIMIAIHGSSFCSSAQRAFKLIITNILRVGAVNAIGTFVLFIGKLVISVGATAVVIVIIWFAHADNVKNGKWGTYLVDKEFQLEFFFVPTIVVVLFSFFISTIFMDVYDTAIDTILLCFCEDLDVNDGEARPYFMPSSLKKLLDKRAPPSTQSAIVPTNGEEKSKKK